MAATSLYMGMNFATQASSMTGATFFWISLTVTVHSMVSTISLPSSSMPGPSNVKVFVSPTSMPMMFSSKPSGMRPAPAEYVRASVVRPGSFSPFS